MLLMGKEVCFTLLQLLISVPTVIIIFHKDICTLYHLQEWRTCLCTIPWHKTCTRTSEQNINTCTPTYYLYRPLLQCFCSDCNRLGVYSCFTRCTITQQQFTKVQYICNTTALFFNFLLQFLK